ncbi:hypothetical protein [Hyalangium gracile]|uniref:hypothetical protein n=1 Tax=Hyalangium gracile TaxID=394092 RepID=UPI001CCE54E9|nr:hypothetical protein [Hyalangium gracile]
MSGETHIPYEGRGGSSSQEAGNLSAPLGTVTQGLLRFAGGASRVTLHVDPTMPELFRARFVGPAPHLQVHEGTVTFRYHFSWSDLFKYAMPWGHHGVDLTLNGSIPWQLEFSGGVSDVTGDLSGLKLGAIDMEGGASKLTLRLPRPSGIIPIHIHGGVSHVALHRPLGTAARMEIDGGAAWLTFDENRLGAVGGFTRLTSAALEDRPSRYEIRVDGGASHITVDTR